MFGFEGLHMGGTGGDAVRYGAYLRMDGNTHARTNAAQGQSTLLYSAIRIVNNYRYETSNSTGKSADEAAERPSTGYGAVSVSLRFASRRAGATRARAERGTREPRS